MPTQTFFNLPEAKRKAIIDIAVDEFANHDYNSASVSRIVARAGIAKGSLYQYFQDKKDLFLYLLDLVTQEKMAMLQNVRPPEPAKGLFPYLRWLMRAGTDFQFSNPKLAQVAYRALYGHLPFRDESIKRVKEASIQYFRGLVEQGIAQGDIAPEVDPELAVFVFNSVTTEFGAFLFERLEIDPERLVTEGATPETMHKIEKAFDGLMEILEHGLSPRPRGGGDSCPASSAATSEDGRHNHKEARDDSR